MVFPIYDDNPFKWRVPPYATWAIILINIGVFLWETSVDATSPVALQQLVMTYGAVPAIVLHQHAPIAPFPPELTLITSMFMHGGWAHLLGNMVFLWVFGDDIEEALGTARFVVFYLLCGIGAALAFAAADPHATTPLVGASGAISGVIAAYLLLRPCAKVSVFLFFVVTRIRAFWVIGLWIALQVFALAAHEQSNVAYMAHIGGLITGALLFLALRPAGVELFECFDPATEPDPSGRQA